MGWEGDWGEDREAIGWGGGSGGEGGTFLEGFLFVEFALGGGGVEGAVFVFGHGLWGGCGRLVGFGSGGAVVVVLSSGGPQAMAEFSRGGSAAADVRRRMCGQASTALSWRRQHQRQRYGRWRIARKQAIFTLNDPDTCSLTSLYSMIDSMIALSLSKFIY